MPDLKVKNEEKKDEGEKEKEALKTESNDVLPDTGENNDLKIEKKDDLLSADHKPDIAMDEKTLKDNEKDISKVKIENEKDQSPKRSRSKSYDRSRYKFYYYKLYEYS